VKFPDQFTVSLIEMKKMGVEAVETETAKDFVFDRVFSPFIPGAGTQEKVFEETKVFATLAAEGINACIFAYGQTGSGKTWTMAGGKDQPGA
jgi:kinesin family protein C1